MSGPVGAYLLQSFSDHPLRLPLVVGLHHLFHVVKNLGVLLVAHVLTGAVTAGLGPAVKRSRRSTDGLLGLRGDGQLLRLLWRRRHRDLLAGAHCLNLWLGVLLKKKKETRLDIRSQASLPGLRFGLS